MDVEEKFIRAKPPLTIPDGAKTAYMEFNLFSFPSDDQIEINQVFEEFIFISGSSRGLIVRSTIL